MKQASKVKYTIGGLGFTSKKAVLDHVRSRIYYQYPDYQDLSADDLAFMVDLLRHHQYADQKIGCGVRRMWIQPNPNFPTKGFYLERHDGTQTDFSFISCLTPSNNLLDFKAACRQAIKPSIHQFRHDYFRKHSVNGMVKCALTGVDVPSGQGHVDHAEPQFDQIVTDYIRERNIDVDNAPMADHSDMSVGSYFTDADFARAWVEYHDSRANLRITSEEANLRRSRWTAH